MKLLIILLLTLTAFLVHAEEDYESDDILPTPTKTSGEITFLFIGNSYTFYPQTEQNPGMPSFFKKIVESINPKIKLVYSTHTVGGYSFEDHYHDPDSYALMDKTYDHVVLQGQSMESLEMTPWQKRQGRLGVTHFAQFLPQIINLVRQHSKDITLFVNWEWNEKNIMLTANHPGLIFPPGTPNAGHKWCGNNKHEYQEMINDSYRKRTRGYDVRLSLVGSSWLKLEESKTVDNDELYNKDWIHPSPTGTFVTALTLAHDILKLDLRKNKFVPEGVDPAKARRIQAALMDTNFDSVSTYEHEYEYKKQRNAANLSVAGLGRTGDGRP